MFKEAGEVMKKIATIEIRKEEFNNEFQADIIFTRVKNQYIASDNIRELMRNIELIICSNIK